MIQLPNRSLSPLLRQLSEPVVTSLLQTDFYKLTMGQYIWKYEPDVTVTFRMKNRSTQHRIADYVPVEAVREQFDYHRTLRATESELAYLRGIDFYGLRMFEEDFLDSLRNLKLPDYDLEMNQETEQFIIRFQGPWQDVTHWEIPCLKIVNELFYRYYLHSLNLTRFEIECIRADGIRRMKESFEILRSCGAFWSDFGTRRAFGVDWHTMAVESAIEYFGKDQFRGTSDTKVAMDHGIMPIGTNAHELPMVEAALAGYDDRDKFVESQQRILRQWWDLYGHALSIALPDTWGNNFFYDTIVGSMDHFWTEWKGVRDDSGDTFQNGDDLIRRYKRRNINPSKKMLIPSDGLSAPKIGSLREVFRDRILDSYGWGTLFSNNLGLPTLSLVCKVNEVNGIGAVKLSNNPEKAIGSPSDIEKIKKIVGYNSTFSEKCIV